MSSLYRITWFEFLVVLLVLVVAYLLYDGLLKKYINTLLRKLHYKRTEVYFTFFNRLFLLFLIACGTICFMLINPLVHSILIILIGAYLYKYMSNYLHGTLLLLELGLKKGMQIELSNGQSVTIERIGSSSLLLTGGDKNHRIQYTALNRESGISIKSTEAKQLRLQVRPKEEQSFEKSKASLLSKLFQHPYIDDTSKIEVNASGEDISIIFSTIHQKYQQNIVQSIDKAGFVIQSMN